MDVLVGSLELGNEDHVLVWCLGVGVFAMLYSVEMKRRIGSIGNLLTRTKVISIRGGRPGFLPMLVRMAFGAMGPLMLVIDWIWLTSEQSKQMIRDLYGGVYVVRSRAAPIGTGAVVFSICFFLVHSWVFRRVVPDRESESSLPLKKESDGSVRVRV